MAIVDSQVFMQRFYLLDSNRPVRYLYNFYVRKTTMFKKIIFASLLAFGTQPIMAFNLDDVNNAANTVNETSNTAKQASDTVEKLKSNSVSGMAKQVATDSAKGGVNGAVEGATSGSVVDGGTKGAVDGAKSSINSLSF